MTLTSTEREQLNRAQEDNKKLLELLSPAASSDQVEIKKREDENKKLTALVSGQPVGSQTDKEKLAGLRQSILDMVGKDPRDLTIARKVLDDLETDEKTGEPVGLPHLIEELKAAASKMQIISTGLDNQKKGIDLLISAIPEAQAKAVEAYVKTADWAELLAKVQSGHGNTTEVDQVAKVRRDLAEATTSEVGARWASAFADLIPVTHGVASSVLGSIAPGGQGLTMGGILNMGHHVNTAALPLPTADGIVNAGRGGLQALKLDTTVPDLQVPQLGGVRQPDVRINTASNVQTNKPPLEYTS